MYKTQLLSNIGVIFFKKWCKQTHRSILTWSSNARMKIVKKDFKTIVSKKWQLSWKPKFWRTFCKICRRTNLRYFHGGNRQRGIVLSGQSSPPLRSRRWWRSPGTRRSRSGDKETMIMSKISFYASVWFKQFQKECPQGILTKKKV